MEASKLKTIDDLEEAWLEDERYELINSEIIKRPMPEAEHGLAQGRTYSKLESFDKDCGSGGWWFMTEISVRYNENQCPTHDIAGWQKNRIPKRPRGVMEIIPDWICEIVSPGHESKDTVRNFNTLMHNKVPYYWIIWPEDEALIAYKLVDDKYLVIESIEDGGKVKVEPFKEIDFDLE